MRAISCPHLCRVVDSFGGAAGREFRLKIRFAGKCGPPIGGAKLPVELRSAR